MKWLPGVDCLRLCGKASLAGLRYCAWHSHHDNRLNRPTGYSTSQGILKWWTRTVTLRRLLVANQACCLLTLQAKEDGGPCGLCSRRLPLDKRLLFSMS